MAHLLLLNGPNLNLLGTREPGLYGHVTLEQVHERITQLAAEAGHRLSAFQSNSFILFNPAGFTHTSVALRDALLAVHIPFIEVHLSNVHARETFRHHSYFSDIAVGTITGLGAIPGDPMPSLVVAVTRFYGLLTTAGDTQIIMTIPE